MIDAYPNDSFVVVQTLLSYYAEGKAEPQMRNI